jgi:hypothetical protein
MWSPKEMALELFQPFLRELILKELTKTFSVQKN